MIHTLVIIAASVFSFSADAHGNGCLATYAREKYWRDGDPSFIEFFKTDEGKTFNCGDVYLAVADASQEGQLPDRDELIQFVKDFREQTENNGTVYFTYVGGESPSRGTDADWAADFVSLVELFLLYELASEYGPVGISFSAVLDEAGWSKVFDAVDDTRRYLARYYPDITFEVDVRLDHSSHGKEAVDEVMRRSNHVSVTTFASRQPELVDMYSTFFTSTCPHCNDDTYEDYKAKVTFVGTGDCSAPCGTTMCDYYALNPNNVQRAYDELYYSINDARGTVLARDRFDYFLKANGTLIGLDHFEESRCIYGDGVLRAIGAPLCGAFATEHSDGCAEIQCIEHEESDFKTDKLKVSIYFFFGLPALPVGPARSGKCVHREETFEMHIEGG
ncbi:hypothetical protein FOZ63_032884 [Perkinsus olseni]|uniref:Chitinase n=1 Tax=Perkinsus olseni TaxID=32597 RepID=A0A7J6NVI7_PEROL|nr:hypothetical protein FOZ60_003443 [Perkinsus olseni]KAF4731570.1 hypothetical protein FOZ62_032437 [Perkinsus olseni]KAF4747473.1 hypothetical protein FOZ63_032884 [Perkinsus olseni]